MALKRLHGIHPEFKHMDIKSMTILLQHCILGRIKAGQRLVKEGRSHDHNIYIIIAGQVILTRDGRQIGELGIGAFVGDEIIFMRDDGVTEIKTRLVDPVFYDKEGEKQNV